jgi:hypothetical protein
MIKKIYYKLKKIFPLCVIILIAALFFDDISQLSIQLYKMSMVSLVVIALHYIRQWLFPYCHLSRLYIYSLDNPLACSIIFASMVIFMTAIIIITVI